MLIKIYIEAKNKALIDLYETMFVPIDLQSFLEGLDPETSSG